MKAIVLTCDKYLFLADHMIDSYQRHWSTNPFTFRVPYGEEYPQFLKKKYGEKVKLIQTDSAKVIYPIQTAEGTKTVSLIKPTVLTLLEDIPDEEWVYWCLDDRYLIKIKEIEVMKLYYWIKEIKNVATSSIQFCRVLGAAEDINVNNKIVNPNGQLFIERENYRLLFRHQFFRAKVLRTIFESFPNQPFLPKEMDKFKLQVKKPKDQKLYISEKNMVIFGESTTGGKLTWNCFLSLRKGGLEIPKNCKVSRRIVIYGELSSKFLGQKIFLPKRLRQYQYKLNWQYIKYKFQKLLTAFDDNPYG